MISGLANVLDVRVNKMRMASELCTLAYGLHRMTTLLLIRFTNSVHMLW